MAGGHPTCTKKSCEQNISPLKVKILSQNGPKIHQMGEKMQYKSKNEILIWAILSSSTVNFGLEMTFSMLFLLFEPIKTKKIQKKFVRQFLILTQFYLYKKFHFLPFQASPRAHPRAKLVKFEQGQALTMSPSKKIKSRDFPYLITQPELKSPSPFFLCKSCNFRVHFSTSTLVH